MSDPLYENSSNCNIYKLFQIAVMHAGLRHLKENFSIYSLHMSPG